MSKTKENMYCGYKKVPKNAKRGTAKYCSNKGQVRYYGIKKIDPKDMKNGDKRKLLAKIKEERLKLRMQRNGLIHSMKMGGKKATLDKIKKQAEEAHAKVQLIDIQIKKLQNELE